MAATALKKKVGEETTYIMIVSLPSEEGVDLALHLTGPDYKIDSTKRPEYGVDKRDEETYHRSLRIGASKVGHFVKDFSTNPEWNPEEVLEGKEQDGVGENRD